MDRLAEFTLRLAAIASPAPSPGPLTEGWFVFPILKRLSWNETRDLLAEASKPVLVAPLLEPGHLGVWAPAASESVERLTAHIRNQAGFYQEKFQRLGLQDEDPIILGTAQGEFTVTVGEFKQWCAEYGMLMRVVVTMTQEPRVAQILILAPGAPQAPLNPYRPLPPATSCGCGEEGAHEH